MFHNKLAKSVLFGVIIVFPFIFVIGMVSIWSKERQEYINSLVEQLKQRKALSFETEISSYLKAPDSILNATKNALEFNDNLDLENLRFENLEKMKILFEQPFENSANLKINSIHIGTQQNYFFGQERAKDEKTGIRNTKINDQSSRIVNEKPDGWEVMDEKESKKFYPTQRPWYQIAEKNKKLSWSEIYCDKSSETPAITAALPLYKDSESDNSDSDQLIAVLGNDLLLSEIHNVLKDFVKGLESSSIFIVDRKFKRLVSDSEDNDEVQKCVPNQKLELPHFANKKENSLVKFLEEQEVFEENKKFPLQAEFDAEGGKKFVRVISIKQENLDWLVVLVLSEDAILEKEYAILEKEKFKNRAYTLLGLSVLILSLFSCLSMFYTREQRFTIASKRFVPEELLNLLDKDIFGLILGDQIQQEMTIMFADVRSFTSLSENIKDPGRIFAFVNGLSEKIGGLLTSILGMESWHYFPSRLKML
jgi:hypothetical protein